MYNLLAVMPRQIQYFQLISVQIFTQSRFPHDFFILKIQRIIDYVYKYSIFTIRNK